MSGKRKLKFFILYCGQQMHNYISKSHKWSAIFCEIIKHLFLLFCITTNKRTVGSQNLTSGV